MEDRLLKKVLSKRFDGDVYDRLSHRYTTLLFVSVSLIVRGNQIVADKIRCFTPTEFTYHQTFYVNDYCFVHSTYAVPFDQHLPKPNEPRGRMINYYQWVSWFFLVQAILFHIPVVIWRQTDESSLLDCIVQNLRKISYECSRDFRTKTSQEMVFIFERYLQSRASSYNISVLTRVCQYSISIFNFSVKLIYLSNSIGQLFLINKFLGGDGFSMWGFTTIGEWLETGILPLSPIFPIVTYCDMSIRRFGLNIHKYLIQCALPVNLFHDRVYLAVWCWLLFVAAITAVGLLLWIKLHWFTFSFIQSHLKRACSVDGRRKSLAYKFEDDYLLPRGVFLLKVIYRNTTCAEFDLLLEALWEHFLKSRSHKGCIDCSESTQIADNQNDVNKYVVDMNGDGYESSVIV